MLYTRTVEPPSALVSLATFVQQVYGPMWFQIKSRPSFTSGAVHLFASMQLMKTQPDDVQKVTKEVVQRNAYFAHWENVLVAMVTDGDGEVRGRAVDMILAARGQPHHPLRRLKCSPAELGSRRLPGNDELGGSDHGTARDPRHVRRRN